MARKLDKKTGAAVGTGRRKWAALVLKNIFELLMIVLTNDDGIDAPGLAALERAARNRHKNEDVVIVAPLRPMSECSHRVTTGESLRISELRERRFAVDGTPADCVRVALLHLLPRLGVESVQTQVQVWSGINAGGNMGADVYISGTVAAVREAAFFGVPGIAFSQYRRGELDPERWALASQMTEKALDAVAEITLTNGQFWNINFPWVAADAGAQPPMVFCERSRRPLPVKYEEEIGGLRYIRGLYHQREYEKGSDIDVCFGGSIAITRISV